MSQNFPFQHFLQNQTPAGSDKSNNSNELINSFLKNEIPKNFPTPQPKKVMETDDDLEEMEFLGSEILRELEESIPQQKFDAYFRNTLLVKSITADKVYFCAPSKFIMNLIEKNYISQLEEAIISILGKRFKIVVEVAGATENFHKTEEKVIKPATFPVIDEKPKYKNTQDVKFSLELTPTKEDLISKVESQVINHMNPEEPGFLIDPTKTFKNFIVGPSNQLAVATSIAVAEMPGKDGQYPSLYIHSNSGLGKTHLLHAIANEIREKFPQLAICIITGREFMKEMVESIQSKKLDQFQRKYSQSIDVLMIDDIHELKNKPGTQNEFFHIFNELHKKGKQLIFTSDKSPKEIDGIEERVKTRLQWGLVIDIQKPDIETRSAILKKKAKEFDMYVPDDVLHLIAKSVKSSVREMEGSLIRIFNYSDIMQVEIDEDMVKEILRLKTDPDAKELDIEDIAKATSHYFKIPMADLKSKSRAKDLVHARHISMYLARKLMNATLKDIAIYFGGRDHSSIIHGINKISDRLKTDTILSKEIINIESKF